MHLGFLVAVGALLVAATNGANDNSKGVATLLGSNTLTYRSALALATVTTFAGSLAACVFASKLVETFQGKGLVPDGVVANPVFVVSVAAGAGLTVLLATWMGFPVSTTHALMGALTGAGLVAVGRAIHGEVLLSGFVAPLLVSPLLGAALTMALYPLLRSSRLSAGVEETTCVCVGASSAAEGQAVALADTEPAGAGATVSALRPARAVRAELGLVVGLESQCTDGNGGRLIGVTASRMLDGAHVASGALVSFARGLNDTPKIAALMIAAGPLWGGGGGGGATSFAVVATAIALGAIAGASRVARTMSERITTMNAGQGFAANLVTAFLVTVASRWGLPVSTTHVACGALFGLGTVTGRARADTIRTIVLAWIVTLPVAAALGGATFAVLHAMA